MKTRWKRFALLAGLMLLLGVAGCSSHRIATINGKTSAKFSNKSVADIVAVLSKSFGPMKNFTAEIPEELKQMKIDLEFSDVSTIEPVQKALAAATGYKVEIDSQKKSIRFVKE